MWWDALVVSCSTHTGATPEDPVCCPFLSAGLGMAMDASFPALYTCSGILDSSPLAAGCPYPLERDLPSAAFLISTETPVARVLVTMSYPQQISLT